MPVIHSVPWKSDFRIASVSAIPREIPLLLVFTVVSSLVNDSLLSVVWGPEPGVSHCKARTLPPSYVCPDPRNDSG